jgi:hypothetical protein
MVRTFHYGDNMKTTMTLIVLTVLALTAYAGTEPAPLTGHTLAPAPMGGHTIAAVPGPEEAVPVLPKDYFTRTMKTLDGKLVGINVEAMTATVSSDGAVVEFTYNEYTVFMKNFKPSLPGDMKPGVSVVGLFDDSDGELYLGRLVEISEYKSRKRRR